ncbi:MULTISPECIES: hypothetical protein [Pelosinus]|uniref:Uncharacterized protein n=1 Tax=Pelosinus fermentans B4 TaxID=1149862 RepID=I8RDZ2_9FIRM|nr:MULTISPECIES: hypothetical protein [Pelosinus]EIW15710.1 hypothetical protein FB4_1399 [Pelosinus fermentans B4]EIW26600.1 hypothetical protein FA11_1604 [Pelosinus fermentans A11]
MNNDYKGTITISKQKLVEIEGKVLVDFLVQVVEPEFNIAYLIFSDSVYAINGAYNSEVLSINRAVKKDLRDMDSQLKRFEPYSVFINKKIVQMRSIGEEWNGHGFEISFAGIHDKSMIIQSIYAGDRANDFDDCIKLGIGHYFYSSESV